MEKLQPGDLTVKRLGEARLRSPLRGTRFVGDDEAVTAITLTRDIERRISAGGELPAFERAGPRERIYFHPSRIRCGIVTCGGLCPGLNDVIRGLTSQLERSYGVKSVLGFRYGYRGLVEEYGHQPLALTAESVTEIHRRGGTILKSSRGEQDPQKMVDFLVALGIDALFPIGGEGTQRGAAKIADAAEQRGVRLAVVGVPKTIDNDIPYIQKSFGFETAVAEAVKVLDSGHIEAHDNLYGLGIVRLMGRDSGFIAAAASVASGDVNFCLVPEVQFRLDGPNGLYHHVEQRLRRRGHALLAVAEGAGRNLCEEHHQENIGLLLRDQLGREMRERGLPVSMKYIDPSYLIRSVPATADDSVFCAQLAHNAVHAAMAGRTRMVVGFSSDFFVHVPMRLVTGPRQTLDLQGELWRTVLESTGQPTLTG